MNAPSLTVPPPRVSAPLLCLLLPTPQVVASGNPNGPNGGPCGPGATDAAAVTRNEFVSVGGGLGAADSASWGGTVTTFGVALAAEGTFDVCYDFAGRGRWSAVVGTLAVLDGATAAGQAQAAAVSATGAAAASAPSILSLSPATVVQGVETVVVVHGRMLRDSDDAVLVREKPSAEFLRALQGLGFAVPEFIEYGADGLEDSSLIERKVNACKPWGWSPDSDRLFAPLVAGLPANAVGSCWNTEMRALYAKSWSAARLREFLAGHAEDFLCGPEVVGVACASVDAALAAVQDFRAAGFGEMVIKAIYGSSGRDQIHCKDGQLRDGQRGWLQKILQRQGEVVVEPWLDRVIDLSLHFDISAEGEVQVRGWTRFLTDDRGQYRGALLGQMAAGLDVELTKFLYGNGRDAKRMSKLGDALAEFLAGPLAAAGYCGPIGVDALVYRDGAGLKLKPVVEINPRTTMGRVSWELRQRVNSARTALWLVLSRREVEAADFASLADCAERLQERYPARLMPDGLQLSEGVVFTTDPVRAQSFSTVLLVGESLQECRGYLASAGLELLP